MSLDSILDKAVAGERLTPAEGLRLLESHDLAALGRAADAVTRRLHPEPYRTYNIDRNINYTNVCTAVCDFCAFYRKPKHRRRLRARSPGAAAKNSRDSRSRRRPNPDAGRPASGVQARVVRRIAARHQVALSPSERPRLQPAGDPSLHQDLKLPLRTVLERLQASRLGQFAWRRRGNFGRSRARRNHARQGDDRRLAERLPRVARTGRTAARPP